MVSSANRVLKAASAAVGVISPLSKVGGARVIRPNTSSSAPWVQIRVKRPIRRATSHVKMPMKGRCARCAKVTENWAASA